MTSNGDNLIVRKHATSIKALDGSPQHFTSGDFNGDGMAELVNYGYDCYYGINANVSPLLKLYKSSNYNSSSAKVSDFIDGFNRKITLTYRPLTDSSVYDKTNYSNLDSYDHVVTCISPLSVVYNEIHTNGASGNYTITHNYGNLLYHSRGRGLLGFCKVEQSNSATGLNTINEVDNWDQSTLLPSSISTSQQRGPFNAYQQTYYNNEYYSETKAYIHTIESVYAEDFEGHEKYLDYEYNQNNRSLLSKERVEEFDGNYKEVFFENYVNQGGRWLPQTVRKVQKHYQDNETYEHKKQLSYDSIGELTSETDFADTPMAVTTTYGYDNFGNLINSTTTANGVENVVKQYTYDSSHRFVTNTLERGYLSTFCTYDLWGNKLSEMDRTRSSHPQTTTYTYDGWGNCTSIITPTGQKTTYLRGWGGSISQRYYVLEQGHAKPWTKTWYDNEGREVKVETIGEKNISITRENHFDNCGRTAFKQSSVGNVVQQETFTYDYQDRIVTDSWNFGKSTSYAYDGNTITKTCDGKSYSTTSDSWGNVIISTDPVTSVNYTYRSNGKPATVSSCGATASMEYDVAGRQITLIDPDAGSNSYIYDAYGRVVSKTDARGFTTQNSYNSLGQLTESATDTITVNYNYGTSTVDKGLLKRASRNGNSISYDYDAHGRLSRKQYHLASGQNYSYNYYYNSEGLLETVVYPDGLCADYYYDAYGIKEQSVFDGYNIWERISLTGNTSYDYLGWMGMRLSSQYNTQGQLTQQVWTNEDVPIYTTSYAYSPQNGNLLSRNGTFWDNETFSYDNLDRLIQSATASDTLYCSFADNGCIATKTGLGNYYYNSGRPHAVSMVENKGMFLGRTNQNTVFNPLGKIHGITDSRSGWNSAYFYGPDNERLISLIYKNTSNGPRIKRTTVYLDDYEVVWENGVEYQYHYLDGNMLCVTSSTGDEGYYHIITDHQGSVMAIADVDGNEVFRATYDPWGRQTVHCNTLKFYRGYTGHEMLSESGLINMNGRVYDPYIGLFISPDNFVQEPLNSQNFNRYTYCLNNPLKYTDPSGELWQLIAGAAILGGIWNLATNFENIHSASQFVSYFGVGAVAGVLSAGFGSEVNVAMAGGTIASGLAGSVIGISSTGFLSGMIAGSTSGFAGTFISKIGNAWIQGKDINSILYHGVKGGVLGAVIGGIAGGIIGGIDALDKGTDFWTGQTTIDLSNAYSASGAVVGEKTISGKYVGQFENIKVFESCKLGDIYSGEYSGVSLPGRGIVVGKGVFTSGMPKGVAMMQHEYGHILQSLEIGYKAYYTVVAPESLLSATFAQSSHDYFWTETWANYLSKKYFGSAWLGEMFGYPAQNLSVFNRWRLEAAKFGWFLFP